MLPDLYRVAMIHDHAESMLPDLYRVAMIHQLVL